MNTDQFRKNIGQRVRLRPIARRPAIPRELPRLDDEWTIQEVTERGIIIKNVRTDHSPIIGWDHVHSFTSDPLRDGEGIRRGFLRLRVQLFVHADRTEIEPLEPGKWDTDSDEPILHQQSRSAAVHRLGNRPLPANDLGVWSGPMEQKSFLSSAGGFSGSLFSMDHLHPDRAHGVGDTVYELEFHVPEMSHHKLEALLKAVNATFTIKSGSFGIGQSSCSWYGFGIRRLLTELKDRDRRYAENTGLNWHHSEDFAYFSSFKNGLFLLSGRQPAENNSRRDDYFSLEATFLFPGLLVDSRSIQRLCRAIGFEDALLRSQPLAHDASWLRPPTSHVHPRAVIRNKDWVSGIIIENPYFGKSDVVPKGRADADSFRQLSEVKHLICNLHDHYPVSHQPVGFRLTELETLSIGSRRIFEVGCRWDDCHHGE